MESTSSSSSNNNNKANAPRYNLRARKQRKQHVIDYEGEDDHEKEIASEVEEEYTSPKKKRKSNSKKKTIELIPLSDVKFSLVDQSHLMDWTAPDEKIEMKLQYIPSEIWSVIFDFIEKKWNAILSLSNTNTGLRSAMKACNEIWKEVNLKDLPFTRMKDIIVFFERHASVNQIRAISVPEIKVTKEDIEKLTKLLPYITKAEFNRCNEFNNACCSMLINWLYLEELSLTLTSNVRSSSLCKLAQNCQFLNSISIIDCSGLIAPALSRFFDRASRLHSVRIASHHNTCHFVIPEILDNITTNLTSFSLEYCEIEYSLLKKILNRFQKLSYVFDL